MMQSGKIMGIALAVSLMACRPIATDTPAEVADGAMSTIDIAHACPSQDFTDFFKAFVEDISLQRAFTLDPYETTVYDPQNLEADPGVQRIRAEQIHFPVILSSRDMAEQGVKAKTEKKANNWYQVSMQSAGTGANAMIFNFRYQRGCWFLTDSVDAST